MTGNWVSDKVVWNEIYETKLSPEDIEKQNQFLLYCQYKKGTITLDELHFFSMLGMSADEILLEIENKEKIVWNWDK